MPDTLDRLKQALADRYAIEHELGSGGMATVYLAEDLKHHRKVAVKVLRPELAAALGPERFLREIEIAARLTHPHILPLHDSGEADGFLFYVMPFVEGQSLRERLAQEGELPIPEALRILRDVVDALTEAHAQGLVHRDIKPENVLLRGRHALVTDFGVAKAVSEATGRQKLTTAGVALGTPAYMAPEQASADPHVDHRVDLYAAGVLAYELLTGWTPFRASSSQQMLAAHMTETPEPIRKYRDTVAPELENTVMRCLAKRPADRWQSADELLQQIELLSTPSGGVTPTSTRPLAALRDVRRHRGLLATGTVLSAVIIAGILVLVTRSAGDGTGRSQPVAPVQLTANPLERSVTGSAISPDGTYLAFIDPRGLHLQLLTTNEIHTLDMDVAGAPWKVWWYPDGTRLLFLGADEDDVLTLWSVSMLGGRARRLQQSVMTAAVAPNGQRIAVIRGLSIQAQSFREVWVMGPNGEDARLLASAKPGESFWRLAWTPDSRALAVGAWTSAGMRIDLFSPDGREHQPLITDPTLFQNWTGILPFAWCADGQLVYARRDGPGHQATSNLWIVQTDTRRGTIKGEPRRLTRWSAANVRELSVTDDCTKIVVLQVRNQADVFVGELDPSGTAFVREQQLTFDQREDFPLGWLPDSRGLLINSARTGDRDIYFKELNADALEPVYRGGRRAVYAPGGQSILFLEGGDIWTVPVTGGGARLVVEGSFWWIRCPVGVGRPCVAGRGEENEYVFFSFDAANGEVRELARTAHRIPFTTWDLSPDGRQAAVVHNDDDKIIVVDLDSGDESFVAVDGWSSFEYISWTAAGDAFFVDAGFATAANYPALLRVEMDGQAHVLRRHLSEWHVQPRASPDGRFVAFASMSFHGNAWLIEGFQ